MTASTLLEPVATAGTRDISSPRSVKRDLRFVRWYSHTVKHVMKRYRDDEPTRHADALPEPLLARVEFEVAAECRRMRLMFAAIVAVVLMPFLLAGFLWSGLYWLPVRILWFPFEREVYGLPLFSLFEWLAFLFLAAFLFYAAAMLIEGFGSTRRVSTDFRRLADASLAEQSAIARAAATGDFPRTAFILGHAAPFEPYRPLLAAELAERDAAVTASGASA